MFFKTSPGAMLDREVAEQVRELAQLRGHKPGQVLALQEVELARLPEMLAQERAKAARKAQRVPEAKRRCWRRQVKAKRLPQVLARPLPGALRLGARSF